MSQDRHQDAGRVARRVDRRAFIFRLEQLAPQRQGRLEPQGGLDAHALHPGQIADVSLGDLVDRAKLGQQPAGDLDLRLAADDHRQQFGQAAGIRVFGHPRRGLLAQGQVLEARIRIGER